MSKKIQIIKDGPFKGKKITWASNAGISFYQGIADEFIWKMFQIEPGDYLITDESSLYDFLDFDEPDLLSLQNKIWDEFGIDTTDIDNGNLLEIFEKIQQKRARKLRRK